MAPKLHSMRNLPLAAPPFVPEPRQFATASESHRHVDRAIAWYRIFAIVAAVVGTMTQITAAFDYRSDRGNPDLQLLLGSTMLLAVLTRVQWEQRNAQPMSVAASHAVQRNIKRWIFLLLYALAVAKALALLFVHAMRSPSDLGSIHFEANDFESLHMVIVYGVVSIVAAYLAGKATKTQLAADDPK